MLLILFAFVAGVGTALSPCVLPVLPIVLSAGATGGKRRPLGIVTGLAFSFTFVTVALVYVISALGLPNDLLRTIAIVGLIAFGIALAIPRLGDRMEAFISRVVRVSPKGREGGFGSGVLVGISLGFVYAPCAGPILAGVLTVSASQSFTAGRLATAFAYGVGSAVALYALMLGGRRIMRRLAQRSGRLQQGMGVVMVIVAVLMLAKLDIKFQTAIAADLPGFLVNPTGDLEKAKAVSKQLGDVRGDSGNSKPTTAPRAADGSLPKLFEAPALRGNQEWFNTPDGKALTLAGLQKQHRVVLIDFWTYTCINCIRTLPQLKAWDRKYRADGLTIIGVHTPEFPFEKDAGNVRDAIAQNGIEYPVVQDNDYKTWNAYENQYWPAHYLIDENGVVRYTHFGEGEYETTEKNIRALLEERGTGEDRLGGMTDPEVEEAQGVATPETYLGAARAMGFVNGQITEGVHDYGRGSPRLRVNEFAYGGRWGILDDGAVAGPRASLSVRFHAQKVFLVMGSPDHKRKVRVFLDGKPVSDADAGSDVHGGRAVIGPQRLYRLVELDRPGLHLLELRPENGTRGYAFTFG